MTLTGGYNNPTGWTVEILDTKEPGADIDNSPRPIIPVHPIVVTGSRAAGTQPTPTQATTVIPPAPGNAKAGPTGAGAASAAPAVPVPVAGGEGSCACNAKGVIGCIGGQVYTCNFASGVDYTQFSEYL